MYKKIFENEKFKNDDSVLLEKSTLVFYKKKNLPKNLMYIFIDTYKIISKKKYE